MEAVGFQMTIHLHFFLFFFLVWIVQVSELGLELEERDGGIFVTEIQEHGCVAVHGRFGLFTIYHDFASYGWDDEMRGIFLCLKKSLWYH